ncbi:hypothetical protein DFH06DRAFT_1149539 [Mycena polygramma]|nr:hypothetical protein DFH06DRAFT_1149539 [Mycena polygramma]
MRSPQSPRRTATTVLAGDLDAGPSRPVPYGRQRKGKNRATEGGRKRAKPAAERIADALSISIPQSSESTEGHPQRYLSLTPPIFDSSHLFPAPASPEPSAAMETLRQPAPSMQAAQYLTLSRISPSPASSETSAAVERLRRPPPSIRATRSVSLTPPIFDSSHLFLPLASTSTKSSTQQRRLSPNHAGIPTVRRRPVQRRAATKKGWKGWVALEDSPPPTQFFPSGFGVVQRQVRCFMYEAHNFAQVIQTPLGKFKRRQSQEFADQSITEPNFDARRGILRSSLHHHHSVPSTSHGPLSAQAFPRMCRRPPCCAHLPADELATVAYRRRGLGALDAGDLPLSSLLFLVRHRGYPVPIAQAAWALCALSLH